MRCSGSNAKSRKISRKSNFRNHLKGAARRRPSYKELQMRFVAAALACAAFLALTGTGVYAADATPVDQAGFHLVLPAGWTEQPNLEQTAVDGFHKGDPSDAVQAFAWASAARNVFLLVQVTTSSQQIPS